MPALNLRAYFGSNLVNIRVPSTTQVRKLVSRMGEHIGIWDSSRLRVMYRGRRLHDNGQTLEQENMHDGDELICMFEMAGGYTADGIYFASPTEIPQLRLEVALTPGLVGNYMFIPGNDRSEDSTRFIEWNGSVSTVPGYESFSMVEGRNGIGQAHAVAWDLSMDAPGVEGSQANEHLVLNDANAVVLEFTKVASYLHQALPPLGLDSNAIRRVFLKYFPELIQSKYVAIRFLEQETYEQLAPLSVSPPPDVITRVVMLYQNLREDEVEGAWAGARERAQVNPSYWKEVIGFDERSRDTSLYRALEWRLVEIPGAN
ncbi:hypothetical protein PENSPDRAFT_681672 [Peniophora sp. CONT]|nr:hypothetical protein PENSPDRAFT_681672 [Peniophora sp. CONT]